jgi:N-methylhydantoinase A
VGIHLIASAEVGKLKMVERPLSDTPSSAALKGWRDVDYILDGHHQADIYDGDMLEPGMHFDGPAIVEDVGTTMVIHPGYRVLVDGYGNLHITLKS